MNFMLYTISTILVFLKTAESAEVANVYSQRAINVTEYCSQFSSCPEGTHVMCMFYNPNKIMGPECIDPENITITPPLATEILEIVNAIRSKVAYGQEKGLGGKLLPRGYGMNRLRWDSELATFAQVLANQCVLRHDLCRATKRFPDPGQTAGLIRFSSPDWKPIAPGELFNTTNLSMDKIIYAIKISIRSWYSHKRFVNEQMIHKSPDWESNPENNSGKHYLTMITGPSTHMGCGISAYKAYHYNVKNVGVMYYSLQIMCNFSHRPKKGQPVYMTDPPTEVGYTIRCGCPFGFDEDLDCLCSEGAADKECGEAQRPCDGPNCKPAVVLLPIFTMEDAPQHKLEQKSRRVQSGSDLDYLHTSDLTDNRTSFYQDSNDIFKPFGIKDTEDSEGIFRDSRTLNIMPFTHNAEPQNCNKKQKKTRPHNSIARQGRTNYRIRQEAAMAENERRMLDRLDRYNRPMDVKKRYFAKPPPGNKMMPSHRRIHDLVQRKTVPRARRPSIFARVHKFELPGRKILTVRVRDFKSDVAPRKDFSYSQKLLDTYLDKKRHHEDFSLKNFHIMNYYETSTLTAFFSTTQPTPKSRRSFFNSQGNLNRYMVSKFHYPEFNISNAPLRRRIDIKSSNEESDKKLMALLDNLEQEVNHIDLNMNEKEIFDAKIRKIYGSLVGRNSELSPSKITNYPDNFRKNDSYSHLPIDIIEDLNKKVYDNTIFETEDKVQELHLKLRPGLYSRPVARSRNPLEYDEKNRETKHCTSDVNSCKLGTDDHDELNRPYFREKSHKSGDENFIEQLLFKDGVRSENNLDIDDIKTRNLYQTELDNKKLRDDRFIEESRKNIRYRDQNMENNGLNNRHIRYRSEFGRKNGFKDKEALSYDDPIGVNRRKQYQQKIDNLEMRQHEVRSYRRRNEHERERAVRLMRPSSRDEVPIRPSVMKSPVGPIYLPERARFLHGF